MYAADELHNKAALAVRAGRLREALAYLREASALAPQNVQLLIDTARVASDLVDHEMAILCARRALRLAPGHPEALKALAESLRQTEHFEEAILHFEHLLQVAPEMPMLDHCIAVSYAGIGREVEAERHFRRALQKGDERNYLTDWEFSHLLLRQGRFAEGWKGYARRFEAGPFSNVRRYTFPLPDWQGEPLQGKSILVHAEQGLGDQIMFASIIPDLLAEGASVFLASSFELVDLFNDSFPQVPVYGILREGDAQRWWSALPPLDYQVPIGNLAVYRRQTAEQFAPRPYLAADPRRVATMQRYLDTVMPGWSDRQRYPLRVGIMWASNPALFDWRSARRGRKKTIPPDLLGLLGSVDHTLFVSLQTRQSAEQAAHVPFLDIVDCSQTLDTMADTAALIEHLDVVLSVDTSVAHLGGGLGKPTWTLLAADPDWRWTHGRQDSFWYPQMRLFRQPVRGEWRPVIENVVEALQELHPRPRKIPVQRGEVRSRARGPVARAIDALTLTVGGRRA